MRVSRSHLLMTRVTPRYVSPLTRFLSRLRYACIWFCCDISVRFALDAQPMANWTSRKSPPMAAPKIAVVASASCRTAMAFQQPFGLGSSWWLTTGSLPKKSSSSTHRISAAPARAYGMQWRTWRQSCLRTCASRDSTPWPASSRSCRARVFCLYAGGVWRRVPHTTPWGPP